MTSTSSRAATPYRLFMGLMLLTVAAALLTQIAQAQTTETISTPPPKYTSSEIERAFGYMNANKDGKVSREEAAGFRGVARHFDAADTNKDNALSREEFERALNHGKKADAAAATPASPGAIK